MAKRPVYSSPVLRLHIWTVTFCHILRVLKKTGGKIRGKDGAAERLGVPYSTLYYRMRKFGIKPARDAGAADNPQ